MEERAPLRLLSDPGGHGEGHVRELVGPDLDRAEEEHDVAQGQLGAAGEEPGDRSGSPVEVLFQGGVGDMMDLEQEFQRARQDGNAFVDHGSSRYSKRGVTPLRSPGANTTGPYPISFRWRRT